MAVLVGAPAINRAYTVPAGQTHVNKEHPADGSGTLDTIKIWANTNLVGCKVATFYATNGDTLKCRDVVTIGAVTAGSEQVITEDSESNPIALAVVTGDYIGIYFTEGAVERDSSGLAGILYSDAADHCIVDDEHAYSPQPNRGFSLNGTGIEAPPGWTGKISGVTNPAKVMGVEVANIAKVKGVA